MEENVQIALERQNPWWFGKDFETGIERLSYYPSIMKYLKTPEILLLVGARRTGKSTLLNQIIKHLLETESEESILFIDFDEPVFQSKSTDPSFLTNLVSELIAQKKIKYLFIDEIQNYEYWAQTAKTIYDTNNKIKIILTGSSSTLLHSVLSTKLSGRYLHVNIHPLSFREFLDFNKMKKLTIIERKQQFQKYLKFGAFPRVVLENNENIKLEILKNYFQTIYLKDVIYPHKLRNNKDVFELLYFIISNVGKPVSYAKISKTLSIAIETVKEYLSYSEEAYLLSEITKFDRSIRKQIINPKKIYCIDTGMINAVSFKFSEDKGRLLENLVYISLLKQEGMVHYHKGNYECDFILKKGTKVRQAIQVTASLKNEQTRKREVRGLLEAMKRHKLDEGLILTEEETDKLVINNKKIIVKPIFEWLLEQQ